MTDGSAITERIIQAIIAVHRSLGPGFLERVYHNALLIELNERGLGVESEKEVSVHYHGEKVGTHRLDLLVEGRVIIELKCVETLSKAHYSQVRAYLKATGLQTAILVNFDAEKADFRRVDHRSTGSPSP